MSPDGTRIVFTARNVQGKPGLWIRDLNSEVPHEVPGTEGAIFSFWSPDQRYIAFNAGPYIKRIALATGLVGNRLRRRMRRRRVTPDGNIIFGRNLDSLYVVPAAGGPLKPFTSLDESRRETRHYCPLSQPDGKYIVFTVVSSLPEVQGIWIAPLSNPIARRRIVPDVSLAAYAQGHLLFERMKILVALPYDRLPENRRRRGRHRKSRAVRSHRGIRGFFDIQQRSARQLVHEKPKTGSVRPRRQSAERIRRRSPAVLLLVDFTGSKSHSG